MMPSETARQPIESMKHRSSDKLETMAWVLRILCLCCVATSSFSSMGKVNCLDAHESAGLLRDISSQIMSLGRFARGQQGGVAETRASYECDHHLHIERCQRFKYETAVT